jgi:hypothetical protein
MGIIAFKNSVHNSPVDVSADSVEGDLQLLPDETPSSISSDEELGLDILLQARSLVLQSDLHRVVIPARMINAEVANYSLPLHQLFVAEQVPDVDTLNLALGDDVQTAVTGVRLVTGPEEELLAVLIYRGTLDQWPFFVYLSSKTPTMERLEESRLHAISTACDERGGCLVCSAQILVNIRLEMFPLTG